MTQVKNLDGFTLLETVVGVSIMAVIVIILSGMFTAFRAPQDLAEAQSNIIGVLQEARAKTLASELNSNHGVHFEETKAVLFRGNFYNAADIANKPYILPFSVKISSIGLTGGAIDVVFTRLQGTTTASGTITVSSLRQSTRTRAVKIFSSGNINSSP